MQQPDIDLVFLDEPIHEVPLRELSTDELESRHSEALLRAKAVKETLAALVRAQKEASWKAFEIEMELGSRNRRAAIG